MPRSPDSPFRPHAPLDSSCTDIEAEFIPYEASGFTRDLIDDLSSRSLTYLRMHYPEMVFHVIAGPRSPEPKGAFKARIRGVWRVARWRTT